MTIGGYAILRSVAVSLTACHVSAISHCSHCTVASLLTRILSVISRAAGGTRVYPSGTWVVNYPGNFLLPDGYSSG